MFRTILSFSLLAVAVSAECSRELLKEASDTYVTAQSNGEGLPNLGHVFIYTENDQAMDIKKGVLSQALEIAHNRSIHDTVQCATFTELIVTNPSHPYVIGTRILYGDANGTLAVNLMESVVTDKGDWAFNATGFLYWDSLEEWGEIPEEDRDTRAVVQAGGDAYFDRFNNESVVVPWGTPCARLEGGAYTGAQDLESNTCDIGGMPSTIKVTNRRYVVDEAMGVVDIFSGFPGLDRSAPGQPVPDSHMFRIEGGKIRYVHTVSACFNDGCGMNGTGIPTRA